MATKASNFQLTEFMLTPPVKIAENFNLSLILLLLGFFIACWFLLYVVTYPKKDRKISREILLSTFSSIYLGLGAFFMMLAFGLNL